MNLSPAQYTILAQHTPYQHTERSLIQASVALVLRDGIEGVEFLLIQRAKHANDPWSGQMAFPGGKIDAQDSCSKHAAMRETSEEVGIALQGDDCIGQLDDILGFKINGTHAVHITPYVFKLHTPVEIQVNHEVAEAVWVPMRWLSEPDKSHEFYSPHNGTLRMPAVKINLQKDQILWGLTLRILANFHSVIDSAMAVLTEQELEQLRHLHKQEVKRDLANTQAVFTQTQQ